MPTTGGPLVAAVDIGSNTLHLIVAQLGAGADDLTIVARRVALVRFGADIAAAGAIGEPRAVRAEAELRAMADLARQHGASPLLALATEGVRGAANADAILARCGAALGVPVRLISGLEEAALTYWGASSDDPDAAAPHAVADLGGGSCEVIVGTGTRIAWANSLPLGSGRLLAAAPPDDPPTAAQLAALAQAAGDVLQSATPLPVARLLAVGGTAASLTRLTHGDDHARVLTLADLARAADVVRSVPAADLAAQRGLEPERVGLLVAGVPAWQAILGWLGLDAMQISWRGVREGAIIAWRLAGDDWQGHAARAVSE